MLKVRPELIQPFEVGTTYILTLPAQLGEVKSREISVTPINANHIKGSVMFLFEGKITISNKVLNF